MWLRIGAAAACFAAVLGFSRFAYGLLVPAMRSSLGGSLADFGAIGAANLAGYLLGSIAATRLAARTDRARVAAIALLAMCASIATSGFARDLVTLAVLRFAVGVFSGVALPLTLAVAVHGVGPRVRGRAASVVWCGGCTGMALVGLGALAFSLAGAGWRAAWLAMAVAGAAAALAFVSLTSDDRAGTRASDDGGPIGLWSPGAYLALALCMAAFGFGYICELTFFGAALARTGAAPPAVADAILGGAGAAGALVWGRAVDRRGDGIPVAVACALAAAGSLLLATSAGPAVVAGAFVLGCGFIGVPMMIGVLAQQREAPERYGRAFAMLTATLGVGQVAGPVAGGLVADRFGASAALQLGAGALALAAVAGACYRPPRPSDVPQARETPHAHAAIAVS